MVYALDKQSGKVLWERVAYEGEPREKRHIKATYANSTPVTDGRIVVAWFGSEGLYAYDVNGKPLWKVDLGRLDVGAYDIPTYEWGTASSPIIWKDLVILQCDTQTDSFIIETFYDLNCPVSRTVINNNKFKIFIGLAKYTFNRICHVSFLIKDRHYYRNIYFHVIFIQKFPALS